MSIFYATARFAEDLGRDASPKHKPVKGYSPEVARSMEDAMIEAMKSQKDKKRAAEMKAAAEKAAAKEAKAQARREYLQQRAGDTSDRLESTRIRRAEVMRLNAEGKTTMDIAYILKASRQTISNDCYAMKLTVNVAGLSHRREKIVAFLRQGEKTTREIAAHICIQPNSAATILRRMKSDGLILRVKSKSGEQEAIFAAVEPVQ